MSAADSIRAFLAPLLPGWRVQFGRWVDGSTAVRYAVIQPVGGLPSSLVRRPQYRLMLIGALNEPASVLHTTFMTIHEAMRRYSGDLVTLSLGEPVFMPTDDGRPVYEISISAIESQLPVEQSDMIAALSPGFGATATSLDGAVNQEFPTA